MVRRKIAILGGGPGGETDRLGNAALAGRVLGQALQIAVAVAGGRFGDGADARHRQRHIQRVLAVVIQGVDAGVAGHPAGKHVVELLEPDRLFVLSTTTEM